jgi:acyl transferase domain-containing protein
MSDEQKAVGYLKRALVDLNETRRRLEEAESRLAEPIAIIGMSCRYPGGIRSPEDLWELVSAGGEGLSDLPNDRGWELEIAAEADTDGRTLDYRGGFIDAGDFDAEFFGIQDDQVLMMDPQQRLVLETAWEACEYAGIDPTTLKGSQTGVFIGLSVQSYASWLLGSVSESPEGYITSGNAGSMASGRVANMLALEGPAITVDTACSSSATALHMACQSLRLRECTMAIAGGVTVMSTPWMYIEFSRQALFPLSKDGRCKSFADSADGAAFSEGVGLVVLERLSDARRLGHEVLAVVRGSAVNQDGASNGLTAPNGLAHERVIRQALTNAGVSTGEVDAVEGHGMGTALGDPIEAQALLATYGRNRDDDRPLWLGSIKSNIGHTQAASTVAGVIKMVMAMRHGLLPQTLHVDAPTRHVDWSSGTVSLLMKPVSWTKPGDTRRAAVHALGVSGTNVHIIIEEPASPDATAECSLTPEANVGVDAVVPWIVSGRDEAGLRRQAQRLARFVVEHPEHELLDIGYSLAVARAQMSHRAVAIGADRAQLVEGLEAVAAGRPAPWTIEGVTGARRGDAVFVMGIGGTDWIGDAAALIDSSPLFAAEVGRMDEELSAFVDWSLRDLLRTGGAELERPGAKQLADFAVAASLVSLWRACGVAPSAVVGYGPGEIAAAHVAGALTLEDALGILAMGGAAELPAIAPRSTDLSLWSAATGQAVDTIEPGDGYRSRAAGEPLKLDEAIQSLSSQGHAAFVEFSSAPVISQALAADAVVVPAIREGEQGLRGVLASLGRLWATGTAVDWAAMSAGAGARRVRLPTYAFDRRRYWPDRSPIWEAGGLMTEQRLRDNGTPREAIHQIGAE